MRLIKMVVLLGLLVGLALPASAERDPTRPTSYQAISKLGSPVTNTDQVVVKAVIHGSSRQLALIGDRYVGKGDEVDGAEIVSVKPGTVLLKNLSTGEHFTVEVFDDSIKTPIQARGK